MYYDGVCGITRLQDRVQTWGSGSFFVGHHAGNTQGLQAGVLSGQGAPLALSAALIIPHHPPADVCILFCFWLGYGTQDVWHPLHANRPYAILWCAKRPRSVLWQARPHSPFYRRSMSGVKAPMYPQQALLGQHLGMWVGVIELSVIILGTGDSKRVPLPSIGHWPEEILRGIAPLLLTRCMAQSSLMTLAEGGPSSPCGT